MHADKRSGRASAPLSTSRSTLDVFVTSKPSRLTEPTWESTSHLSRSFFLTDSITRSASATNDESISTPSRPEPGPGRPPAPSPAHDSQAVITLREQRGDPTPHQSRADHHDPQRRHNPQGGRAGAVGTEFSVAATRASTAGATERSAG
jgi:hypothetical protein